MAASATASSSSAPSDCPSYQPATDSEGQNLLRSSPSRLTGNNCFRRCCGWTLYTENWLSVALVLQALVGTARLLTPRPIVAIANFFLAFLGFNPTHSPAVVRLFFLSFFSLIVGLSDLFWLIVKFTGPFGSAWLNPQYYWRPLYPSIYDNVYVTTAAHDSSTSIETSVRTPKDNLPVERDHLREGYAEKGEPSSTTKLVPLSRIFPPEKPPALWRIYVELVCLCVNPLLCLVTSWLAWTLYKRIMGLIHSAEFTYFSTADERMDYGSVAAEPESTGLYGGRVNAEAPVLARGTILALPSDHADNALLQPSHGAPAFVPFVGEGRRLGADVPETDNEV